MRLALLRPRAHIQAMIALLILAAALALSVLVAVLTHGHVLFFFLPLAFGLPLAALFRRRP